MANVGGIGTGEIIMHLRQIGTIGSILITALGATACSGTDRGTPEAKSQSALSAPGATASSQGARQTPPDGDRAGRRHGPPSAEAMIQRLDKNGDGKLEVSELPDRAKGHLAAADTNHDGVLSVDELKAAFANAPHDRFGKGFARGDRGGMGGRDLMRFDENHDGKIELDELPPQLRQRMESADTNMDGILQESELKAFRAARFAERFKEMDKNGDGVLTADEVDARRWSHMVQADANKDGKLSLAELQQAHENGTLRPPEPKDQK